MEIQPMESPITEVNNDTQLVVEEYAKVTICDFSDYQLKELEQILCKDIM